MGIYNVDAVSGTTDYSKGGNYLPSVDGEFGLQLCDLKYVPKMGKSQSPAYIAYVSVLESENPKVVVGRKYELILGLNGSEFDMLAGIKRLVSFVGAFAGVEPNTPFQASKYLDDSGKGEWMQAAAKGELEKLGLLATVARRMVPMKKGGLFPRDTFLPFTEE